YANRNRGIFFSGSTIGSTGGLTLNNLLEGNTASGVARGIQVNEVSRDGYRSGGNVSADTYATGTPVDATDIDAAEIVGGARLVNPSGIGGIRGGPGSADDDFHLQQKRAGQVGDSAALDAGVDASRRFRLERATTRTDGRHDRVWVDAGYHYGNYSRRFP